MYSNPIEAIVTLFGGQNAMARRLGRAQSTVWYWVQQGAVPQKRMDEIIRAGKRMRPPIHLEPSDFFSNRKRRSVS
jgi:DNA-binding transcriptional regulator YdaS (Cro superfamily)